ncbi:hypothetical protein ACLM5H_12710 [Fredinandcohnia humi]
MDIQKNTIGKIIYLHLINKLINLPKKFSSVKSINSISFYPIIETEDQLAKIYNLIAWYIPNYKDIEINIFTSFQINDNIQSHVPDYHALYINDELTNTVKPIQRNINIKHLESDLIFIWDKNVLKNINVLMKLQKCLIIDPTFYSHTESSNLREINYNLMTLKEKENSLKLYNENYKKLLASAKQYSSSTVFGSGPSIEKSYNHDFNSSFTIICNSLVKNKKLLHHIRPNVITFGDPVLHFSLNKYANEFRNHVLETVMEYNSYCVVPEKGADLLIKHFPEIKEYIIGIPMKSEINFPDDKKFFVKSSSNILTLFMLPIASAIADQIYIIGSDGREKKEKLFWQHSPSVQFNDLMDTVYKAHPSFFRDRIYTEYYNRHVNYLEELIKTGEKIGKKYYSLEDSYIDALRERRINNE